MKSLEIICCLFIIIFALAVAHPLPDNVLEQVEAKQNDGGILPQESVQSQVLPSPKLDPEAVMFSEEALEAIFNDTPQERELQKEE
ncbi:hypothetical protein E2320_007502 [Naja naja]|nr:hypothetical protein E2320_007502 [Naja naja]